MGEAEDPRTDSVFESGSCTRVRIRLLNSGSCAATLPVRTSHTRTTLSSPPVVMRRPHACPRACRASVSQDACVGARAGESARQASCRNTPSKRAHYASQPRPTGVSSHHMQCSGARAHRAHAKSAQSSLQSAGSPACRLHPSPPASSSKPVATVVSERKTKEKGGRGWEKRTTASSPSGSNTHTSLPSA
jgi:hypothetical protein